MAEEYNNQETNTPEGINNRLGDVEERIRELEDRASEIPSWTEKTNKQKQNLKKEDNLADPWGNIKHTNKHTKGPRKRTERERGRYYIWRYTNWNFS